MVDSPGIDQEITVASFEAIAVNTFATTAVTLTEYNSAVSPASAPRYANCQDELLVQLGTEVHDLSTDWTDGGRR